MTMPSTADVTIVAPASGDETRSYVDWPAILAGVILASAISVLMLAFGSAIGLSFTNFNSRPDVSPIWVGIAAASWLLWVEVSSFMAGGYITGRLRRRANDATEHEVDVRDGAHGLLVWAGSLVLGAVLATAGVGILANAVGSTAATLTTAASNVAGGAAEGAAAALDPNAYFIDTLFRPAPDGNAAAENDPAATETPAATESAATAETPATTETPAATTETAPAAQAPLETAPAAPAAATLGVTPENDEALRAEAGRIFAANTVTGEFSADDRTYLAQVVASETGMPQAEAEARVDQVIANVEAARTEAAEVAETARKTAVIGAFLLAASLLVSAIGAWWAATVGGKHRDEGTVFADVFRRF